MHIEHLDSAKFVQHSPRGQSWRERTQPGSQGYVEAIGHESHKDVRFNPLLQLVKNGAQRQNILEVLKSRFDLD